MSNPYADKLDVMMLVMFEYIEGVCFNEGKDKGEKDMKYVIHTCDIYMDLLVREDKESICDLLPLRQAEHRCSCKPLPVFNEGKEESFPLISHY